MTSVGQISGAGGISGREDVRVVVKRPLINLLIHRPQRSDAVSRFIVVAGRVTRHVPPCRISAPFRKSQITITDICPWSGLRVRVIGLVFVVMVEVIMDGVRISKVKVKG